MTPPHALEPFAWWSSLRHGGLLISPSRLPQFFPERVDPLAHHLAERLRRDLMRVDGTDGSSLSDFLDTVLEPICGLRAEAAARWLKGSSVGADWSHHALTGESVKPRRVWEAPNGISLPVFVDREGTRLGIGRGRRAPARVIEWLRAKDRSFALLTNGKQWRLIHAGLDHDAFAEWDADLWFEEGRPGAQVDALRVLLARSTLVPASPGEDSRLLAAVRATRAGQAELSSALGERVRQAVERLIQEHGAALDALVKADEAITPRDIYLAATQVVMRMVVLLFAESREGLLPVSDPIYHESYGLRGLREWLGRAGSGAAAERLGRQFGAWPRILALFRLVHEGSAHEAMPVVRYGGELFRPGDAAAAESARRALAAFESAAAAAGGGMNDSSVRTILDLLCTTRERVRQGRGATWAAVPVDFSDLSSAYIGILYEGLLDFELHRAHDDVVVFLNVGDEPALPLGRLEAMDDAALGSLVEKFKEKKRLAPAAGEDDGAAEEEEEPAEEETEEGEEEEALARVAEDAAGYETEADRRQTARERAEAWARRAVQAAGLVPRPRSRRPEAQRAHLQAIEEKGKQLVLRTILPGEWYLVRWGGTRKGAGTFYTRPELAVPTVRRALRPLAYEPPAGPDGWPDEDAAAERWAVRRPEEILALEVCDPACGSGSFLVASLRFLTDALYESLHRHGRIRKDGGRSLVGILEGCEDGPALAEELLPCPPDDPEFEGRLRARLKRYVVERCLYGVDLDPLAVELARLSLWIETMDRNLPFSFLDHKVKCGNSLVGCWFDRFRDYPALAWEREGGDKSHTRGVHFPKEGWTKAIREFRTRRLKPALADWIRGQGSLFDSVEGRAPEAVHDEALAVLAQMHDLPVHASEERAEFYRDRIAGSAALARLREAFDAWCALWFWPADRLDAAPLPAAFAEPREETRALVREIAAEVRFFHWELEFPDVFARPGSGFDAVVGNPPWEIQKPSSKEFFSNLDPLYRTYGKQDALGKQEEMFRRSQDDERAWLLYCARFKALSNFTKHAASPFGDGADDGKAFSLGAGSDRLHDMWRSRRGGRTGYADRAHPFRWQGSADVNTYKLFLEAGHALLRDGGRLGFLVPSGLYTDKGTTDLRTLFLTRCRWRWLFGFENRDKIFDIDSRFKFCPVIVEKGGTTDAVRTAFMRRDVRDWEDGERHVIPYSRAQVERFSPRTRALLEIREKRDLEILEKIYANSVLLGDESPDGWGIKYAREFDMTNDSHLFHPRPWWEARGYVPDIYGRWIKPRRVSLDVARARREAGWIELRDGSGCVGVDEVEDVALPLYQGVMIGQFDFCAAGYVSGGGNRATWREQPWPDKRLEPQFLMSRREYTAAGGVVRGEKVVFRDIARTTDCRTFISAVLPDMPCGNKVPILGGSGQGEWRLAAAVNSMACDCAVRQRLGGTTLNFFIIEEVPVVPPRALAVQGLALAIAGLLFPHPLFAHRWTELRQRVSASVSYRRLWAVTDHERLRLRCILDAVAACAYGLGYDDLAWILRECDRPAERLRDDSFSRTLDPKGFWRIDKEKGPELRHTILTLAAFRDLKAAIDREGSRERGVEAFCDQNGGEGWMLPETLRLSDLGLGHDHRAKHPQPVRERLGPRHLPWQLEQSVEESWAECERHARNLSMG